MNRRHFRFFLLGLCAIPRAARSRELERRRYALGTPKRVAATSNRLPKRTSGLAYVRSDAKERLGDNRLCLSGRWSKNKVLPDFEPRPQCVGNDSYFMRAPSPGKGGA